MPLADTVKTGNIPSARDQMVYPGSISCNWVELVSDPENLETEAIVGSTAQRPGNVGSGVAVNSDNRLLEVGSKGTHLLLALKYDKDAVPSVDPVVRVFGRDHDQQWHVLFNNAGTPSSSPTLVTAASTDCYLDADYKITTVHQFDVQGSLYVLVCVQTAFAADITAGSAILGKILNSR